MPIKRKDITGQPFGCPVSVSWGRDAKLIPVRDMCQQLVEKSAHPLCIIFVNFLLTNGGSFGIISKLTADAETQ